MTKKDLCFAETYISPTVKVVRVGLAGVLCESLEYTVSPTEVAPAERSVYNGGNYDSLD